MSARSGPDPIVARSHAIAMQRWLRRLLESHGALTYADLSALARADAWPVPFGTVLERAVASGRVVRLPGDLYGAGPHRDEEAAKADQPPPAA